MINSINLPSLNKVQLNRYIKSLQENLIYLLNECSDDTHDIQYCQYMLQQAKRLL